MMVPPPPALVESRGREAPAEQHLRRLVSAFSTAMSVTANSLDLDQLLDMQPVAEATADGCEGKFSSPSAGSPAPEIRRSSCDNQEYTLCYCTLLNGYQQISSHRNTVLWHMVLSNRVAMLQRLGCMTALPPHLHQWLAAGVDGYVGGLVTYLAETMRMLDAFQGTVPSQPNQVKGETDFINMDRTRFFTYSGVNDYRCAVLNTLAVAGQQALVAAHDALQQGLSPLAETAYQPTLLAVQDITHSFAAGVTTYLEASREVLHKFTATTMATKQVRSELIQKAQHSLTQLGLEQTVGAM